MTADKIIFKMAAAKMTESRMIADKSNVVKMTHEVHLNDFYKRLYIKR